MRRGRADGHFRPGTHPWNPWILRFACLRLLARTASPTTCRRAPETPPSLLALVSLREKALVCLRSRSDWPRGLPDYKHAMAFRAESLLQERTLVHLISAVAKKV